MNLLELDFAHFGYPHTLMTDNAPTFMSDEFQDYCQARGIVHLTGAPYHPATKRNHGEVGPNLQAESP